MWKEGKSGSPRWVSAIVGTFAISALVWLSIPRLFYPSLHMDESLYIGAALRILNGDPFLTDYWFDKFFMTPLFLAAGILVGGENQVGFRIAGLVCSCYTVQVMVSLAFEITGRANDRIAALPLLLGATLAPFMIYHHGSSLTDPFLLLFLVLFGRSLLRAAKAPKSSEVHARRAYHFLAIASLFKLSSLMWSPMLGGFWLWRGGWQGIRRGIPEFFKTTKWWIVAGIAYSLANPDKLGPILWFKHLGAKTGPGLFERAGIWVEKALGIFGGPWVSGAFFLLTLLTAGLVILPPRRILANRQRALLTGLFAVPFLLHVIGLWLSGAATFDRYLYILVPQGVLVVLAALELLPPNAIMSWVARGLTLAVGILLLFQAGISYEYLKTRLNPPDFGRALFEVRDETAEHAVVHHDGLLWYLYPFDRGGEVWKACQREECFALQRLGRDPFGAQYWLRQPGKAETTHLLQAMPLCPSGDCKVTTRFSSSKLQALFSPEDLREGLRIGGWADTFKAAFAEEKDPAQKESQDVPPGWFVRPGIPVVARVESRDLPLIGRGHLEFKGRLVLIDTPRSRQEFGEGRWVAALRLEDIRISGLDANLVDLAPLLYKSYVIPIRPVNVPTGGWVHDAIVGLERTRTASGEDEVTVTAYDRGGS